MDSNDASVRAGPAASGGVATRATHDPDGRGLAGMQVLLVEDDDDLRLLLSIALERAGLEVVAVETGEDALSHLEEADDVDLVLLDIRLPGIDGFEVLRRMSSASTPTVIAMSAHAHHELAERAVSMGCATYITKPFMPSELAEVLERQGLVASG